MIRRALRAFAVGVLSRFGRAGYFCVSWKGLSDMESAAQVLSTMRLAKLFRPQVTAPPCAQRVVVIAPHPDDEVIGMGGTLVQMVERGCDVHVVYVTSGRVDQPSRLEAQGAAKKVGFRPAFMGFSLKQIPVTDEAVRRFEGEIGQHEPDHLFVPFFLDDHDDHRRVNELLCRTRLLDKKLVVWGYQVYSTLPANVVVDITTVEQQKRDAIACYRSQFSSRDWSHYALGLNAFNVRYMPSTNTPSYAEVYLQLPLREYQRCARSYFGSNPEKCYTNEIYRQVRN